MRDQDKSPAAPDVKRVLRELASEAGPKFGFKVDIKDAHRLVPVSPQDWHLLRCRSSRGGKVYINTTGTFGVASAAYWWSRVATALVRALHYFLGRELASWLLLVADDLAVFASHGQVRTVAWVIVATLRLFGLPLSWKKLGGAFVLKWVGHEILLKEAALGLTASRAEWVEGWYTRLLRDRSAQMQEFREGLGRVAFVFGALDCDRPFLASLYAFSARHADSSVTTLASVCPSLARLSERKNPCAPALSLWNQEDVLGASVACGCTSRRRRSDYRRLVASTR